MEKVIHRKIIAYIYWSPFTVLCQVLDMFFAKISIFTALASVLADVKNVKLVVNSDNTDVNGSPLVGIHEGAGFNFVFLVDPSSGASGDVYKYDDATGEVYKSVAINGGSETSNYTLSLFTTDDEQVVQEAPGTTTAIAVQDGQLAINGSTDAFYVAKDLAYDPYGYSITQYALVASATDQGQAVKVNVNYV